MPTSGKIQGYAPVGILSEGFVPASKRKAY